MTVRKSVVTTKNDPHRQLIIIDTAEWQRRLEQLAEMRRTADDAQIAKAPGSRDLHDRFDQ